MRYFLDTAFMFSIDFISFGGFAAKSTFAVPDLIFPKALFAQNAIAIHYEAPAHFIAALA